MYPHAVQVENLDLEHVSPGQKETEGTQSLRGEDKALAVALHTLDARGTAEHFLQTFVGIKLARTPLSRNAGLHELVAHSRLLDDVLALLYGECRVSLQPQREGTSHVGSCLRGTLHSHPGVRTRAIGGGSYFVGIGLIVSVVAGHDERTGSTDVGTCGTIGERTIAGEIGHVTHFQLFVTQDGSFVVHVGYHIVVLGVVRTHHDGILSAGHAADGTVCRTVFCSRHNALKGIGVVGKLCEA